MSGAIAVLERHLGEGYRVTAVVVDEQTPVSMWGHAVLDRPGTLLELRDRIDVELLDAQDYDFALKRVHVH